MSASFMPANASLYVPIWGSANVPHKSEAVLKFSFWSPFPVHLQKYAQESPPTKTEQTPFELVFLSLTCTWKLATY